MYIVANRVPVMPEWAEQFEARFRNRIGQIDQQPGFVSMQVLRPADDDSPYVVLTAWQDKAAFESWVGSEDFRQAHRHPLPKEAYRDGGRLERHEVVIETTANGD